MRAAAHEDRATSGQNSEVAVEKRSRKPRWIAAFLILGVLVWAGIDLLVPVHADLKDFDPDEVARLETAMWRSYYDRHQVRLFNQLSELMRTQYHLPYLRSNVAAFHAARAAFVFKDGKTRSDYERALPDLISYYQSIQKASGARFDVEQVAQVELEWWIVHRDRAIVPPGALDRALADLPAQMYGLPADLFREHAHLRAQAMGIRDDEAQSGGVTEEDWTEIDRLVHESWRSLWSAVRQ